ncbi:ATP-binding protein [Pectinatus brassicae]|uniref:ORC1/DEAH AAA+ ATPase domain-containing protein n=1 Tax=Pectinatus brassicae TaxID=862415 RepID=A0A840UTB5_9FIRM|nr:ATP-binding protein [Pectinatus brassicae]MBB5335735.1 hypothetical protein [Pectinatus brassicae]
MKNQNHSNSYSAYESAVYRAQKISDYDGNPLIEALPPILETEEEVIDAFYHFPIISEEEKRLSPRIKSHILWRVKSFLQPLPAHIRLESIISTLIRHSYQSRNPLDAQYKHKMQILNQMKNLKECTTEELETNYQVGNTTAECVMINGVSGAGKTTAINRTLHLYPQVIKHFSYKGQPLTRTQIVWLKIDCPYDGNFATLCRSIFAEIDRLTNERWLEKYGYLTRSTSTMLMHMTTLLINYNVGVLVIDEIQHLSKLKKEAADMLDFLVTLTNMFSVPLIFIGTSKSRSLFQHNFRLARRVQSGGYIEMGPLKQNSAEWDTLLESLWEFNVLDEDTELTQTIKDFFYDQCQGVISLAVMLFMCAQSRALLHNVNKMTPAIIKEATEHDLKFTQPMITALRSGDPLKIAEFDDISINEEIIWRNLQHDIEMEDRVNEAIANKRQEMKNKRQASHDALYFSICSSNIFPNFTQDVLRNIIDTVVSTTDSNIPEDELKMLVMQRIFAETKNQQQQKKKQQAIPNKTFSLLKIYDEAIRKKEHPYELFKKKGLIKNPFEEFTKVE